MQTLISKYWILAAAIWYTGNGILHDIFVAIRHKGGYDREILRLLLDGHVLILSGVLMFISYMMVSRGIIYGVVTALAVTTAMLIYCLMIFPFLRSFGTIAISLIVLIVSIIMLTNK